MSDTMVTHIYKIFSFFSDTLHFIKLYLIREKNDQEVKDGRQQLFVQIVLRNLNIEFK